MSVFICISTYNEGINLLKTVESVYSKINEITDQEVNVIISDDGSTDSSVCECLSKFKDIKVTKRNEPSGTSAAKGHGADLAISISKSEYDVMIFLDGHTFLYENCLKNLVNNTIKFGIVCPVLKGIDNKTWEYTGSTSYGGYFDRKNFTTKYINLSEVKDGPIKDLKLTYRISGGACSLRRDVYNDINGWDKEIKCFGADASITLRSWCFGYDIYLDTSSITGHVFRKQFRAEVRPRWSQLYLNRLRLVSILGNEKDLEELKNILLKDNKSIAQKTFKEFNSIKHLIPNLQCKIKRTLKDYWSETGQLNAIK